MYTHIHSVLIANAPFGALAALRILFICQRAAAMLLHHALAPLPSTNSEARATATCVGKRWKSFFQPVRLQPDVARHARAPAPLGSRREVSHERPSQDKTPLWEDTEGGKGAERRVCDRDAMYVCVHALRARRVVA